MSAQVRVLNILASVIDINPGSIRTDRQLVEYGLDSARVMDLVVALEDEFGVSIPDDVARTLHSVDDILGFLARKPVAP